MEQTATPKRKSGMLANLAFNIIIPTLIMTKLSGEDRLGPAWAIVVALAFPLAYGVRDWLQAHKPNFFSLLGIISVLLTGGMSLMQLDAGYIAIKEAAIPGLLGLATLISTWTRWPLVRVFLFNEQVMRVDVVRDALRQHGTERQFERRLTIASWMVAGSFFLSSALNYGLAKYLLVSPPGTPAFTEELGRMTALSFPVIALPSTVVLVAALFYLLQGVQKLTHLQLEDLFQEL
jgi:hypothetical protein